MRDTRSARHSPVETRTFGSRVILSATRVPATESTEATEGISQPTTGRLRRVAHVELAPIQLSRRQ